ncbi:E3 ubiquitin-protein ligase RNF180-like isoform X2 [Brienomyrus brachyistius]|uniref:E3 ubiquitin-protein ligase RNF180-like isoform X2 n=1 Tax=Brienomyrus brachyistius TaxID=42636 RepID=UPI0020B2674F|nr:E3 ubiquitin-protein ligase RNF180-like isoform X2 [Brienomyrus brachyistius]
METAEATTGLRCRRCRTCVMDSSSLLQMSTESDAAAKCNIWHVNFDPLPDWIHRAVHQAQWTRGKLLCPHCGARLGGFDFLRQASCPCGRQLTVHLSESRVDRDHRLTANLSDSWVYRNRRHPRELRPSKEVCHLEGMPLNKSPMGLTENTQSTAPQLVGGAEPSGLAELLPTYRITGEETSPHAPATTPIRQQAPPRSSMEEGGREGDVPGEQRRGRRERNYMRSLRRKRRGGERGLQSQWLEQQEGSTGSVSSSDGDAAGRDREGLTCAVCLDIYFNPYMCHPCGHVFCEPCLRTLARNCPSSTPCPLCRTPISHVCFQIELNHTSQSCFPEEYISRRQNFKKANCAQWPLPNCGKIFRILGFRRHGGPVTRRQFPHGASRLDSLAFEGDSRGWRLDMDVLVVYIYSVNWLIGFVIFCFVCYYFFSSL